MTVFKQAIIELVFLTLASVTVALAVNEIRERKAIEITKDYFRTTADVSNTQSPPEPKPSPASTPAAPLSTAESSQATPPPSQNASAQPAATPAKKRLEHGFQTVTVDEAHEIFDDPGTEQGLNVFIDARDDEYFAEGHIPGAIQCYPYEMSRYYDRVKAAAEGAEKVIVYCGGGDCEDSAMVCKELQDMGIPYEAIYLFEGGWKEWAARGLHAEKGLQ